MHVIRRRGWEIPESQATPEHIFLNRRKLLTGAAATAAAISLPGAAIAQRLADVPDPTAISIRSRATKNMFSAAT
jgi:methionine sulfoxide reductase catalytic subunit